MPKLALVLAPQVSIAPVVAGLCAAGFSRLQSATESPFLSVHARLAVVDSREVGLSAMNRPPFCAASR